MYAGKTHVPFELQSPPGPQPAANEPTTSPRIRQAFRIFIELFIYRICLLIFKKGSIYLNVTIIIYFISINLSLLYFALSSTNVLTSCNTSYILVILLLQSLTGYKNLKIINVINLGFRRSKTSQKTKITSLIDLITQKKTHSDYLKSTYIIVFKTKFTYLQR